jgi:hypothetical protein
MLVDHRIAQERCAESARRNRRVASEAGEWFLQSLAPDWFVTITPPSSRFGGAKALASVQELLADLEHEAGQSIGWIVAEARNERGGGLHFHALVSGVAHLRRKKWWRRAFQDFGRSQILPYDDSLPGAEYVAKNGLSEHGNLHFGGGLWDSVHGTFLPLGTAASTAHQRQETPKEERTLTRENKSLNPRNPSRPCVSSVNVDGQRPDGTGSHSSERPIQRIFVSAVKQPDGNGAFAWLNEASGKRKVEVIAGANKIEAEYHGCLSALEWVPEGSQIEIISDSALLCGQSHDIARVRGHSILRLRARLMTSIHCQRLDVDVLCVPRSDNHAWKLLKRYR